MPYLYTLAYNSTQTGVPINTPKFFYFTHDPSTYLQTNDFDFMVGESLLAAPVYARGASSREVYLPSSTNWYDWYSDLEYTGSQNVLVNAPLGTIPLFVKEGAIIPIGPDMNYANEFEPNFLDIHIWPGLDSEWTLYEDDGEGYDYLNGAFKIKAISLGGSDVSNFYGFFGLLFCTPPQLCSPSCLVDSSWGHSHKLHFNSL